MTRIARKVYVVQNYYDDGYEHWEKDFHGCVFATKELADEAVQKIIELDLGEDTGERGDLHCYVITEEVLTSIDFITRT